MQHGPRTSNWRVEKESRKSLRMPSRVNISPYRSPVVSRVLARSADNQVLAASFGWGLLNLLLAAFLAYDIVYSSWLTQAANMYLGFVFQSLLLVLEYMLGAICTISFLLHAVRFVNIPLSDVTMSTVQGSLLKQAPGTGVVVSDLYRDKSRVLHSVVSPAAHAVGLPIAPLGNLGSGYVSSKGIPQRRPYRGAGDMPSASMTRQRRAKASVMSTPPQRMPLGGDGSITDLHSLTEYLHSSPLSGGGVGGGGGGHNASFDSLNYSSANGSSLYASPSAAQGMYGFSPVQMSPGAAPHHDMTTRDFSPLSARYQVASRPPSAAGSGSPGMMSSIPQQHHHHLGGGLGHSVSQSLIMMAAAATPAVLQDSTHKCLTDVWAVVGVERDLLDFWTEKCRRWLSRTIVQPLAGEIESLNKSLRGIGCAHLQLGQAENHAIQKVGLGDAIRQLPNLSLIIKYLDLSANQDYLVWRINELARGTCLSSFRWDGGGRAERGDWDTSLPTDVAIIFHLFSTYMDSCLPPSPRIPDRRTFSLQYVKPLCAGAGKADHHGGAGKSSPPRSRRSPGSWLASAVSSKFVSGLTGGGGKAAEAANFSSQQGGGAAAAQNLAHVSEKLHFVQCSERPPHFQLCVAGKLVDVGGGRNNLFHSLLYFLHHVKNVERGMLGTVNLPLVGMDVLNVVSDV